MKPLALTAPAAGLSRRQFLKVAAELGLSAAGLAMLEACGNNSASPSTAAGTLETTTIRIPVSNVVSICLAPIFMAYDFLKAEGFTDVQYLTSATPTLNVDS